MRESRGGRPGLPVLNSPGLCGRKATFEEELRSNTRWQPGLVRLKPCHVLRLFQRIVIALSTSACC